MYCILISGLPASGKTSFAKALHERLNIPIISKDELKEIMFDAIGFRTREEKLTLGLASTNLAYYFVEKMMDLNFPFIIDNNFENSSRQNIEELLIKHNYNAITVMFNGDISKIYERFIERDKSPVRHRGHILNTEYPEKENTTKRDIISMEAFEKRYTERGMHNFSIGEEINVDCTYVDRINYDFIIKDVIKKITITRGDISD